MARRIPTFYKRNWTRRATAYKVVNQGTSGATTKDALAGLPFVLRLHPAVVIVEFGGNDGLRGLPVEESRSNLDQVLTALEKAHVKILLAGITLPPDYGPDYIRSFNQMFRDLAARHHVAFVPMLYVNLVHVPGDDPGRRHPSHREGFGDHCRHVASRAPSASAQSALVAPGARTAPAKCRAPIRER